MKRLILILTILLITTACDNQASKNNESNGSLKVAPFVLTERAIKECRSLIDSEDDDRAALLIAKGHHEIELSDGNKYNQKDGWMIFVVNKEQFTDKPKVTVNGLEFIFPQESLYSELNGKSIDYVDEWWKVE